jgi:hypothetical protein
MEPYYSTTTEFRCILLRAKSNEGKRGKKRESWVDPAGSRKTLDCLFLSLSACLLLFLSLSDSLPSKGGGENWAIRVNPEKLLLLEVWENGSMKPDTASSSSPSFSSEL